MHAEVQIKKTTRPGGSIELTVGYPPIDIDGVMEATLKRPQVMPRKQLAFVTITLALMIALNEGINKLFPWTAYASWSESLSLLLPLAILLVQIFGGKSVNKNVKAQRVSERLFCLVDAYVRTDDAVLLDYAELGSRVRTS